MLVNTNITFADFVDAFRICGRENQFSYEGLEIIYNYLDELDENIELDVVAICYSFSEIEKEEVSDTDSIIGETENTTYIVIKS